MPIEAWSVAWVLVAPCLYPCPVLGVEAGWALRLLAYIVACQCNGHSTCDELNSCISCTENTTGSQCESCVDGFFGDTRNGGLCESE